MEYFDQLAELFEGSDGELFKPAEKKKGPSPDDRLLESFNEIEAFVQKNGRMPDKEADDIKEASLGMRLVNIRSDKDKSSRLEQYDEYGLLELEKAPESLDELFSANDGLFKTDIYDIEQLPRTSVDKRSGDSADRKPVEDFEKYKHLFQEKQRGLADGTYQLRKFLKQGEVVLGGYYIIDGMMCFVDDVGEKNYVFGRQKERLRVIYENGTESNIYLRTLSSQLYNGGYIVVRNGDMGETNNEPAVGYIYILQSQSSDPKITTIKDLYKIGVTRGSVEGRIKNASTDPTYLMSEVKTVDTYKLTGNYNPHDVETMIHNVFADARVEMEIIDNSGKVYVPSEWYNVPLHVINEAVDLIYSHEITSYIYDREIQELVWNDKT